MTDQLESFKSFCDSKIFSLMNFIYNSEWSGEELQGPVDASYQLLLLL